MKRVYTIGAAAEKIESQITGARSSTPKPWTSPSASRYDFAQSGDIVLLAPACASFDQFQSYEHRGRLFKDLVRALES